MSKLLPTRRIILEAIVLVTVAMAAGLSLNYGMVKNAFSGRQVVAPPAVLAGVEQPFPQPVDYEELDGLLAEGDLLIDARDQHAYAAGHLPGAVSLPLGEFGLKFEAFAARIPAETPLIIYCNGFGCPDSFDLGLLLIGEGYSQVKVYEGGFPEWRDNGRQLEIGGAR